MREMVFRERQERVANVTAIAKMIAKVFNIDSDRAFGDVLVEYASEVFQTSYDLDLMKSRIDARRRAKAKIDARRKKDQDLLKRLERMGDFYDQENTKKNK